MVCEQQPSDLPVAGGAGGARWVRRALLTWHGMAWHGKAPAVLWPVTLRVPELWRCLRVADGWAAGRAALLDRPLAAQCISCISEVH